MPLDSVQRTTIYHSYLVRFWQSEGTGVWRASAQNVQTGAIVRFADVTSLLAFLLAQTGADTPPAAADCLAHLPFDED